jgi:hypothetical protein
MQLSDPTNNNGIIQRAYFYAFGDSLDHSADWPLKDVVALANDWVRRIATWIWQTDLSWQFDDSNYSTLPEATTNLVANQRDYGLPSTVLKVEGVSVKDAAGNWYPLKQIDREEVQRQGVDLETLYQNPSRPVYYDLVGNTVKIYPAADNGVSVTLSGGLKIFLQRDTTNFSVPASYTTADTTTPGFPSVFHDLVPMGAAYDYLSANDIQRANNLFARIQAERQDLADFVWARNKDKKVRLRAAYSNFE